jgi:SlyX protein
VRHKLGENSPAMHNGVHWQTYRLANDLEPTMSSAECPDDHNRLLAMEERITFLQRSLDELNEVVIQQDQRLESLKRELSRLGSSLERLADASPGENLPHEKPPHY